MGASGQMFICLKKTSHFQWKRICCIKICVKCQGKYKFLVFWVICKLLNARDWELASKKYILGLTTPHSASSHTIFLLSSWPLLGFPSLWICSCWTMCEAEIEAFLSFLHSCFFTSLKSLKDGKLAATNKSSSQILYIHRALFFYEFSEVE